MNSHDEQRAKLLAETFNGDWTDGPASAFARAAAAHARRRHTLRRSLKAAAATTGMAAAMLVAMRHRPASPPEVALRSPTLAPRGYEIISDDELLAQIRDRPLLVMKKPDGMREITLLATDENLAPLE